jgi:RNA polymerase sigma-70 factor, ECF subfamily
MRGHHVRDQELPEALAIDLDGSFEQLVLAFQDRLYAFALRLSNNPQDAEEITQDAFVRAYRALDRYPPERVRTIALRPWLYQIALNIFRNRVRNRPLPSVPLNQRDDGRELESEDVKQVSPDMALEHAEFRGSLATLVAALPERYRLAVVMRHVQGFDYGEIAAVLKQPIGTVKANVHRGTRMLREALEESERTGRSRPQMKAQRGVK